MEEIKCPKCGSGDVYTKADGEKVCRKCGHKWRVKE